MKRAGLPFIIFLILLQPSFAAEHLFNGKSAIEKELFRLRDEAKDVLRAPFGREDRGLLATALVAGGLGLTYLFDDPVRKEMMRSEGRTLDKAADAGSAVGNPLVHLGVAGLVYGGGILGGSKKWEERGLMLGEAVFLADSATMVLKESIGRARPRVSGDKGQFKPFHFASGYDSLPSLHAASSFAVASVMSRTSESLPVRAAYYSAATFAALSRLYQNEHWASDVVLGAVIGELCGRVVARYHGSGRKHAIVLLPIYWGHTATLSLSMKW